MPSLDAGKPDGAPEARSCASPLPKARARGLGRRKTNTVPKRRAYASWEDENKENIDPRTRKATATSPAKPKALSSTTAANVVKPTRARRRRDAIVPVGSPRCVSDLENAFAALAMASRR